MSVAFGPLFSYSWSMTKHNIIFLDISPSLLNYSFINGHLDYYKNFPNLAKKKVPANISLIPVLSFPKFSLE